MSLLEAIHKSPLPYNHRERRIELPWTPRLVKEFSGVRSITYDPLKKRVRLHGAFFREIASLKDIHRVELRKVAQTGIAIVRKRPVTVYHLGVIDQVCAVYHDPERNQNILLCGEALEEARKRMEETGFLFARP